MLHKFAYSLIQHGDNRDADPAGRSDAVAHAPVVPMSYYNSVDQA
jgi:hypothetical protein